MTDGPWHERWREGRIGFHQDGGHPRLTRWWRQIDPAVETVLVPLCGKSHDLWWLVGQGHRVLGIELVPAACRDLFRERGVDVEGRWMGERRVWSAEGVTVLEADVFSVAEDELVALAGGLPDAVYDRAALVAIAPERRRAYMTRLAALLAAGAEGLAVVLEYPQDEMTGPPWSVSAEAMESACRGLFTAEAREVVELPDRAAERGLSRFAEHAWYLRRTDQAPPPA